MVQYTLSPLLSPAGSSTWEAGWLPPTPLNPCCKSWGLSACNSWPWANKRLKLFTGKKKRQELGPSGPAENEEKDETVMI